MSVSDELNGLQGASVSPYQEGYSVLVTVTDGDVQIATPEPSMAIPLTTSIGLGLVVLRRRRQ